MQFRKNYVQEKSIPIVNVFKAERQGRGKAVNGAQVRVHMQIVVEMLHSAKVLKHK